MAKIDLTANEDLSDENIEKAHASLEAKGTKKAACEILGIKYNTARLAKIINEYFETKERDKRLRAKKRREAISPSERLDIITEYLAGNSVSQLSDSFYRSQAVLNRVIDKAGARMRSQNTDYFNPILLPEECLADSFEVGQVVWSARHNCLAEVMAKFNDDTYRIWLGGGQEQQSYQPYWELGSLAHLEGLKLKPKFLESDEVKIAMSEAFKSSKTVKMKES